MKTDPNYNCSRLDHQNKAAKSDWHDWQWQMANRVCAPGQLASLFDISPDKLAEFRNVVKVYPLAITPYYFSLINRDDPDDPLRRQSFPDLQEIACSNCTPDPLEEARDTVVPGLIHRYPDRCLIIMTNVCSTYCRHCNRKRIWKKKTPATTEKYFDRIIERITGKAAIREVILSGGDPLTMDNNALEFVLAALQKIPHIEVIRIGSRTPVVMPMRITRELCSLLKRFRPLWFNTQFNHPREITPESAHACNLLLEAGIPVSSQTVLLKGVNDNYETMRDLLYGLHKISVRPYYLFHCDPVQGTDHFRTEVWSGMEIMEKLWKNISGLCLPRYVLDVPGGKGKIPLQPYSLLHGHDISKA